MSGMHERVRTSVPGGLAGACSCVPGMSAVPGGQQGEEPGFEVGPILQQTRQARVEPGCTALDDQPGVQIRIGPEPWRRCPALRQPASRRNAGGGLPAPANRARGALSTALQAGSQGSRQARATQASRAWGSRQRCCKVAVSCGQARASRRALRRSPLVRSRVARSARAAWIRARARVRSASTLACRWARSVRQARRKIPLASALARSMSSRHSSLR
jgi:hypothetical protein